MPDNKVDHMDVPFAGVLSGKEELEATMKVAEGTWLGHGPVADQFEKEFAEYIGVKYALFVNSGSSANMLALAGFDLPKGSKVIVAGGGFPATLNPVLHLGLEPIVIDLNRETHQVDLDEVEAVATDAKAIIFAHTLGLTVDMDRMMEIAKKHSLKVIEDSCEALGTMYKDKMVGAIGDAGTYSFYPSHQMTALGGGGMVVTNNKDMAIRMKSMREWGKRQIDPGFEGDYHTEFSSEIQPGFPYARSYIYDTIGWNFKFPEANAAYGLENFRRMQREDWNNKRFENYKYARKLMEKFDEFFDTPALLPNVTPSSFGYCITMKESAPLAREELIAELEAAGVRVRPFFAGNILLQPAYRDVSVTNVKGKSGKSLDAAKDLPNATYFMHNSFFFGTWPGLNSTHMDFIVSVIDNALSKAKK